MATITADSGIELLTEGDSFINDESAEVSGTVDNQDGFDVIDAAEEDLWVGDAEPPYGLSLAENQSYRAVTR